ncbi:hypothetical protein AB833_21735 [Chromatiales bacterium (ex Bugula neritina AB1)]|nr:hypothetical protein AB833_21735 [Chromatiales bacterium (ex Bugula neritina AB1)]
MKVVVKQQVPEGYRRTEIGVFPLDWEIFALKDIVDNGRLPSGIYKDQALYGNGTQIIKLGDVFRFDIFKPKFSQRVLLTESEKKIYRVKQGDIFIALASVKLEGVGKVMLVKELDESTAFDHNVAMLRSVDWVNSSFLAYLMKSSAVRVLIGKNATQVGTSFLKASTILSFPLALPGAEEQKAIAKALSDTDALIAALENLITKKRAIKTATMQQLLTGKTRLPGFGEGKGYKDSELGRIPEDWEVVPLSWYVKSLDAGVSVNSDEASGLKNSRILKTSCVYNGGFIPSESKAIVPKDVGRAKRNPRKNTILISRMNTPDLVGECGYVDKDYDNLFLPDRLWITSFYEDKNVSGLWLASLLSSSRYRKAVKDGATGTSGSMKNISKDFLLQLRLPKIQPAEQKEISNVIASLSTDIRACEFILQKVLSIKTAMMQQLLTGRTRLI